MPKLKLDWEIDFFKEDGGLWFDFEICDLPKNETGVYIIWYETKKHVHPIYTGQGDIKDCIKRHRKEQNILQYKFKALGGILYVTWAKVSSLQLDGVEKYLSDKLDPLEGERFPDRKPIRVTLPWD